MMITAVTIFLAFAAFLNSIEISSGMPPKTRDFLANFGTNNEQPDQQDASAQVRCSPNNEPIPGVHHWEPSSSSDIHFFAEMCLSPARPDHPTRSISPAKSPSPAKPDPRGRSRSPQARFMAPPENIHLGAGHNYELNQLEFIRLTSFNNPRRQFELRRYTFPADKPIRLLLRKNVYVPIPTQEQIVLSTAEGEIFAILETSSNLAGIYSHRLRYSGVGRVKLNMEGGQYTPLTKDEIQEVPVGRNCKIVVNFKVDLINGNPPQQ